MPAAPSLLDLDPAVLADARAMPPQVRVPPLTKPFNVTIEVPGSKSLTNRVLLLAALSSGRCEVRRPLLDAQDAQVMIAAIRQLGARVEQTPGGDLMVWGTGSRWKPTPTPTPTPAAPRETVLHLANAGTATRFLAAAGLLAPPGHTVTIDGSPRMRERPIGELVQMLRDLGGTVDELGKPGFPPIRVHGLPEDAQLQPIRVGRTASSQFVSAVLLLGPFVPGGVSIAFDEPPTSEPYVRMTMGLLERVGAAACWQNQEPGVRFAQSRAGGDMDELRGFRIDIEPDASSAGYWWTAEAMVPGGRAHVPGPWTTSLQGDVGLRDVLAKMRGAGGHVHAPLRAIDADLANIPDAAMALAAACAVADGPSTLRGLRTLRVKETDRVEALRTELSRLGCGVQVIEQNGDVALRITPMARAGDATDAGDADGVVVRTYDDHRMAMGLALIGLKRPGVIIDDPACVAKTYATFWRDLRRLYDAPGA